jgi:two-component system response regulator PilR (NtrC family)
LIDGRSLESTERGLPMWSAASEAGTEESGEGYRASGAPAARGQDRPRLLVIDDEEDIRETLALVFGREGWLVTTAESGEAAVHEAEHRRFDVALTDLRMPGMSGADTITALRSIQPRLPIVVATGYASEETAADCFRRGAVDYVRKPFDLAELMYRVKRQIG